MIKDSGERTEFKTGAVRDMKRGVGRMDLLPWYGIMEVSKHCEEGAEKYGEHNVDKGIPLHSLCDSAARHLAKFIAGETDEDHLRAATWNLLWALNQRKTHPELDDLYSHKEKVERVRNLVNESNKAEANGEVVFKDGPDTINEECETDKDKNMYALGMFQMAKIVIAATREINIVGSYSAMYAMGVSDTVEKICTAIDATIDNVEDIFEKEWV